MANVDTNGLVITGKVVKVSKQQINDHTNYKFTMISQPGERVNPIYIVFHLKEGGDENNRMLYHLCTEEHLTPYTTITCMGHVSSIQAPNRTHDFHAMNMTGVMIQDYQLAK